MSVIRSPGSKVISSSALSAKTEKFIYYVINSVHIAAYLACICMYAEDVFKFTNLFNMDIPTTIGANAFMGWNSIHIYSI